MNHIGDARWKYQAAKVLMSAINLLRRLSHRVRQLVQEVARDGRSLGI